MLTTDDLQAIKAIMQEETKTINNRLDKIETRLDNIESDIEQLKEDTEITRDVTNSIGEWIDFYFKEDRPYPIPDNVRKLG